MDNGFVKTVSVGRAKDAQWAGRLKRTAIDKRPVEGRVMARALGLDGDEQADPVNHGGLDQAVYVYAREELDRWQERMGRPLRDGMFGENLTTVGTEVDRAVIGERWRVGDALFEVVLPRTPCAIFKAWLDEPGWVKTFTRQARTGAYLRVLQEGELSSGDTIVVEHRPDHGIDLQTAFTAVNRRDIDLLDRVLTIPGRSATWEPVVAQVRRRLAPR